MAPAHWAPLREGLGDDFSVTCPALPGHCDAPPRPGWRPEALADQWVEQFPDAHWIGWSLGGLVALAAALRHPQRVQGLVLIGATPRFVTSEDWPYGMSPSQFREFRGQCLADPKGTLIQFTALQMQSDRRGLAGLRALRAAAKNAPAPDPDGLQHGLDVLEETDLRGALGAIECPTLWLTGEGDVLTPPAAANWAAGEQPRARSMTVADAGHAPFITDPTTLSEQIRIWLREHPLS
jgi:pimeloyl-[acyl-carrier protein] methyl ester esterase